MRLAPRPGQSVREGSVSVGPGYLGLSAELAAALQFWADWHDQHQHAADLDEREIPPSTADDWRRWGEAGATLAERLADETGAEVVYNGVNGDAPATDCACRAEPPQR
ncbi:hypothetical protein ODJ79_09130 [Actinoplanes sp. KI2]|uniref:hypothetical protein n=1 Tax=Actinoplanes sp. KI2 TaxID=2983315 RepID=UPI0021D5A66B|nr:hypothetical protein [Actinoplanes sp. KI2]MCU7723875.1 hypothetical protein [Actinoplanes sp. KI2]